MYHRDMAQWSTGRLHQHHYIVDYPSIAVVGQLLSFLNWTHRALLANERLTSSTSFSAWASGELSANQTSAHLKEGLHLQVAACV